MTASLAALSFPSTLGFPTPAFPTAPARRMRVLAAELPAAVLRGAVVVDVRSHSDRAAQGTLPGALAIDPALLAGRLDPAAATRLALAVDRNVEWVLVSTDGRLSSSAARALRLRGLHNVADVAGGYRALHAEGGVGAVSNAQHLRREAQAISAH